MSAKEHKNTPEYVKSGYLYRLTSFIEWPQVAFNFTLSPFMLGLYGDKYIHAALFDTFRDRLIKDRDWKAEYYSAPGKIVHCHMLFVMKIEPAELRKLISSLATKKTLTVGDNIDNFCQLGGMINLVGTFPNYGYEVNTKAIKSSGLVISREFLELASIIE
jgi:hypothetical protein